MKPHSLASLFDPRSVAVVGADDSGGVVGQAIFANLLAGDFQGKLFPVSQSQKIIAGMSVYPSVRQIEEPVDLLVVATAVRHLPDLMFDCGIKGVKAVLLAKDFSDSDQWEREILEESMAIARHYGLRVLGPNVFGLMRPVAGFNASTCASPVLMGGLALVSQSSAVCSAMLDWAHSRNIGFSSVISVGDALDVDFGEILDYLVADRLTQSILLHVHNIHDARRFMSALRAAARSKSVVVAKSGRHDDIISGLSHASSLISRSNIFDTALTRAGVFHVETTAQLLTAAKMLVANCQVQGDRLAIVSNGKGPGVQAADSAVNGAVTLAQLSPATLSLLNQALPRNWSGGNPLDIIGDASPSRFRTAVKACLDDPEVDAVLVVFTPQTGTDPLTTAQLMAGLQRESQKPVLLCWLGGTRVDACRELFSKEKCAHFRVPEYAIEVFCALVGFYRNRQRLLQIPGPLTGMRGGQDFVLARSVIDAALSDGRTVLSELESKQVLAAFQIPVNQTLLARNEEEAVKCAARIAYPVALKIDSADIFYKSDVGGVELNICNEDALRAAYASIISRTQLSRPDARVNGISVQSMRQQRFTREIMIGVMHDPVFGPVITFGSGGIAAEVTHDCALALPPLDRSQIGRMIAETRIGRLLGPFKNMPAVDRLQLERVLLRVSEMICELPQIHEMDINPLVADEQGIIVLDARIVVSAVKDDVRRYSHMAIMPYPASMVKTTMLDDGTQVVLRPIRPEDAQMLQAFVRDLSEESRYSRYMSNIKQLSPAMLARFTQLDYDREMALLMLCNVQGGAEELLAVARFTSGPDNETCEFALEVADAWQGHGIGHVLLSALFDAAREQGLKTMSGEVLASNKPMLGLMKKSGFSIESHEEDPTLMLVSRLL